MLLSSFRAKNFCVLALTFLFGALMGSAAEQQGVVQSGRVPIAFSTVTLYSAGTGPDSAPAVLARTKTDARGLFSVSFARPQRPDAVLYLIAEGGFQAAHRPLRRAHFLRLATVIGMHPAPSEVVINERTTVATAYAMAQFISGTDISGKYPGLQNAADTVRNLVDLQSGEVGSVLARFPNGLSTSTMREFNTLANLLASCVDARTDAPCATLFGLATPPGGDAPLDTLQAAVNIAHFPWQNPVLLFQQAQLRTRYRPYLLSAPDAWTLAIRYEGNGHEFDGPGNMAIDRDGDVWITNNYEYNPNPFVSVCGSEELLKLSPTGVDMPGAPYSGGGLYGAGFGIALDPLGKLWVSNFGFQGKGCTKTFPGSVSKFNGNGVPLSPAVTGFRQGSISQPQGTAADQQANVWIANCGNDSVTLFPGGNPQQARNFSGIGLSRPFGLAVGLDGNIWIASNGNDSVIGLSPDGSPLPGSPFTGGMLNRPLGVAVDSLNNVWITNSGIVELPCAFKGGFSKGRPSVTKLTRTGQTGQLSNFTGGGLILPWGIAVDGNDNIWVANFGGHRLTELCGARPSNCPPGLQTGDPISPSTGYSSNALQRNTGVAIDASGNVWLANNWLTVPVQTNPGGHAMVVFIGLAAPVKTPVIGPPQQP